MIEPDAAALVLRGWADDSRAVRVVFTGRDVKLNGPICKVFGAQSDSAAFKDETGLVFEFVLRGCLCEFADAPSGDKDVESAVVFRRPEFTLVVMLLRKPA